MIIISIDVGEKNLGYTVAQAATFDNLTELSKIKFHSGVYNLNIKRGKNSIIISRVDALSKFIDFIIKSFGDDVFGLIIEKQVSKNYSAMEMMYSIIGLIYQYTKNIFIFDPKLKFNAIDQIYSTVNKSHKKLSISNMEKLLKSNLSESFSDLNELLISSKKKDDIADSFNQLIIYLSMNNLINLSIEDIKKLYEK